MLAVVIICSICYLIVLGLLMHKGLGKRFDKQYLALKTSTSILFVVLAFVTATWRGIGYHTFISVLPSLLLCVAGDVLLAMANVYKKFFGKYFLAGAISFAIGHALFILVFYLSVPSVDFWAWWMFILPVFMAAFVYIAGKRNKRFKLGKMVMPGTLYSICVGLMTMSAVRMCMFAAPGYMPAYMMAAGAILFFISDVILMFMYFYYKPRRTLRAFNFATYYLGMMLIALAC